MRVSASFVRDTGIVELAGLLAFFLFALDGCFPRVVEALAGRILQGASGLVQHGRERGDGLAVEVRAGGGFVDVDVGDGFGPEFVGELLSPFGGTGEADFFAVPTADHEGAARAHAFFSSSPRARVSSIMDAVPLEGSTPPKTQASR